MLLFSGLSGSGKTILGKEYASKHNYVFIDGNSFFLSVKPRVQLSNGHYASNWDCPESIDWNRLNTAVLEVLKHNHVILVTFMPRFDLFQFNIYKHIRLSFGADELNKCILARRQSKNITNKTREQRDELMIREYVYPMYQSLQLVPTDGDILTYNNNTSRKQIDELVTELYKILKS